VRARLAQYLIGLELLPLQSLHLRSHVAADSRPGTAGNFSLVHPFIERLRRAADLGCYRANGCPSLMRCPVHFSWKLDLSSGGNGSADAAVTLE
jgi:hypothetical protein